MIQLVTDSVTSDFMSDISYIVGSNADANAATINLASDSLLGMLGNSKYS